MQYCPSCCFIDGPRHAASDPDPVEEDEDAAGYPRVAKLRPGKIRVPVLSVQPPTGVEMKKEEQDGMSANFVYSY